MTLESILWVAVALAAAPLAGALAAPLKDRWPRIGETLEAAGPWLYGLGPAYLALIRGAVLARPFGLYGRGGAFGWAVEIVMALGLLAAAWIFRGRLGFLSTAAVHDADMLDEPRWALYRAAGILWTGSGSWGLLAGLGLGLLEWATRKRLWRPEARRAPATCLYAFRLGLSTILFALTGNVWMTAAFQGALWKIVPRREGAAA
jgi:hypothetical protein